MAGWLAGLLLFKKENVLFEVLVLLDESSRIDDTGVWDVSNEGAGAVEFKEVVVVEEGAFELVLKALNPLKPENTLGLSSLDVSIGLEPKLPENNENG